MNRIAQNEAGMSERSERRAENNIGRLAFEKRSASSWHHRSSHRHSLGRRSSSLHHRHSLRLDVNCEIYARLEEQTKNESP